MNFFRKIFTADTSYSKPLAMTRRFKPDNLHRIGTSSKKICRNLRLLEVCTYALLIRVLAIAFRDWRPAEVVFQAGASAPGRRRRSRDPRLSLGPRCHGTGVCPVYLVYTSLFTPNKMIQIFSFIYTTSIYIYIYHTYTYCYTENARRQTNLLPSP